MQPRSSHADESISVAAHLQIAQWVFDLHQHSSCKPTLYQLSMGDLIDRFQTIWVVNCSNQEDIYLQVPVCQRRDEQTASATNRL